MNRWKGSYSWLGVWGVTLVVSGLILYSGYQRALTEDSREKAAAEQKQAQAQEKAQEKESNETAQGIDHALEAGVEEGQAALAQPDQTAAKSPSATNTSKASAQEAQEIREGLNLVMGQSKSTKNSLSLQDFPCPVKGTPLRTVGNYYSEEMKDYLFHAGVDYAEPEGTMVRATHGGKVIFAGLDPVLGQKVTLDCGEGWTVTYGGLENLRVKVGDIVQAQSALGQVGFSSGAEGGEKRLHYEVWHNDLVQNPLP